MRWVAALVLAAVASSAAAKPTTIHNESRTWAKGDIATLVSTDGFVVIALTMRDYECSACGHVVTQARELFEIDAPGVWHVYVMYVDGRMGSADEIVAGARLPVIALYADGHLIAARSSNASRDDATAWLERNAARAAKLDGASPLDCAQRLIDLVISPGRIGADDLVRMRDL
ncbi:MAG TPA: hypothetical protein VL463_23445, partial [Kofleriaceae bacterium]|nr:hypothetical protein [Kofleriaceae bacterium]